MGRLIKSFSDGSSLEYDQGSFDAWCVYQKNPDGSRKPPKDVDYFRQLKELADTYGAGRIYDDYTRVYDFTRSQENPAVFDAIERIASTYGGDALKVDKVFSILYMAMIAEERKEHTRLGKRIKRLGIHELLIENRSVEEAANFMRGMKASEIDALCKERGF